MTILARISAEDGTEVRVVRTDDSTIRIEWNIGSVRYKTWHSGAGPSHKTLHSALAAIAAYLANVDTKNL